MNFKIWNGPTFFKYGWPNEFYYMGGPMNFIIWNGKNMKIYGMAQKYM